MVECRFRELNDDVIKKTVMESIIPGTDRRSGRLLCSLDLTEPTAQHASLPEEFRRTLWYTEISSRHTSIPIALRDTSGKHRWALDDRRQRVAREEHMLERYINYMTAIVDRLTQLGDRLTVV